MSELTAAIGSRIKTCRERRGLSQTGLARASGVRRELLCKYEAGRKTPEVETLLRIGKALGVGIEALV